MRDFFKRLGSVLKYLKLAVEVDQTFDTVTKDGEVNLCLFSANAFFDRKPAEEPCLAIGDFHAGDGMKYGNLVPNVFLSPKPFKGELRAGFELAILELNITVYVSWVRS